MIDIERFRREHGEVRINLGSNKAGIEGWINIDNHIGLRIGSSRFLRALVLAALKTGIVKYRPGDVIITPPPNLMIVDLTKCRLPFKDESVDFVYTSHFLEHLPRYKTVQLLKEVNRVLRKGGTIRIIVPDLETLAREYVLYKDKKRSRNPMFRMENEEGGGRLSPIEAVNAHFSRYPKQNAVYTGFRGRLAGLLKTLFPNEFAHKWMYDFEDMRDALRSAGFGNIKKLKRGIGKVPDLKRLEQVSYESLYVEAEKLA